MSGLFSTLDIGSSGISAQQAALNVTAHNIANASTDGYTRQRADLESVWFDMGPNNPSGFGVNVDDIERIRDSFLDYQVRNATSEQGTNQSISNYLSQIQDIINEPSNTGISTLITNFYGAWNSLASNPTSTSAQQQVVENTKMLTDALNGTYSNLQDLKTNCHKALDTQITTINSTLDQIDSLNSQIMQTKALGVEPNDLMDKRDSLLDTLSGYFNISVDNKDLDGINVTVGGSGQLSGTNLVQTQDVGSEKRLAYISNIQQAKDSSGNLVTDGSGNPVYDITYYQNGDMSSDKNKVDVYVSGLSSDQLQQMDQNRVIWTNKDGMAVGLSEDVFGKAVSAGTSPSNPINVSSNPSAINLFTPTDGSVIGTVTVQSDVDKYTDDLNSLAKAIAFSVNAIESDEQADGGVDGTKAANDKNPFFVNSDTAKYTIGANGKSTLTTYNTTTDEPEITAGNITINTEIYDNPSEIKSSTEYDASGNAISGNTDGKRALDIYELKSTTLNIQGIDANTTRDEFFSSSGLKQAFGPDSNGVYTLQNYTGGSTINDYFTTVVDQVATEVSKANATLSNQQAQLQSLEQSRSSVSGVSLDDEMTDMIKFQHAYEASAKIISTTSDLLDVVIGLIR